MKTSAGALPGGRFYWLRPLLGAKHAAPGETKLACLHHPPRTTCSDGSLSSSPRPSLCLPCFAVGAQHAAPGKYTWRGFSPSSATPRPPRVECGSFFTCLPASKGSPFPPGLARACSSALATSTTARHFPRERDRPRRSDPACRYRPPSSSLSPPSWRRISTPRPKPSVTTGGGRGFNPAMNRRRKAPSFLP